MSGKNVSLGAIADFLRSVDACDKTHALDISLGSRTDVAALTPIQMHEIRRAWCYVQAFAEQLRGCEVSFDKPKGSSK